MIELVLLLVGSIHGKVLPGEGAFKLDGIFSITEGNHVNIQSGFMMMQAMNYAIEKVNNETGYLYGYTLAVNKIYDVHSINAVREQMLTTFKENIPFVIGPYSSETSYIASILTGTFGQIAISYSATYSDFDQINHSQENMLRTVPSDKFRVQAALKLLKTLSWNYVTVISSYKYDGESEATHFIAQLSKINVCLDQQFDLPKIPTQTTYEETIDKLTSGKDDNRVKGVVLFTNIRDTQELFSIIQKRGLGDRLAVICLYGCTSYIEVTSGNEESLNGTLSIDIAYDEMPGFQEYYMKLKPDKDSPDYFKRVWEKVFDCSLGGNDPKSPCTGDERFSRGKGFYPQTPVHSVMDAIYAISNALRVYLAAICDEENIKGLQRCVVDVDKEIYSSQVFIILLQLAFKDGTLSNFNVPYNSTAGIITYDIHQFQSVDGGGFKNVKVGKWTVRKDKPTDTNEEVLKQNKVKFYLETSSTPLILCSEECPYGHKRVRHPNLAKAKCCWSCEKCQKNSISVNESCVQCAATEMVVMNRCHSLPEVQAQVSGDQVDRLLVIYVILVVVGLGLVLFVTVLFIYFNDNVIVRCSGRDLCYMLLIGIALLFLCPVAYMVQPALSTCVFRGALPGMAFLLCYAPLFLRVSRIYRIFVQIKKTVRRPLLISTQAQILTVIGIVCLQILLASIWFTENTPSPAYVVSDQRDFITVQCSGDDSAVPMLINLALSVVFMICSTVIAFKTRHFPKNYNEAKFIGVTLYITCVIWAVFLPAYYLTPGKGLFLREYLISGLCITIGYVTLFGLFGQKIKLLLCENITAVDKNQQMQTFSQSDDCQVEFNTGS